jgi:hypothetical protein
VNHRRLLEARSIRTQVLQALPQSRVAAPRGLIFHSFTTMCFIVFVSDTNEIASLVLQALCAGYFYQSAKRAHSHVFRHQNQSLFVLVVCCENQKFVNFNKT